MIRRERLSVDELVVDPIQARDEPWINDEADRRLAASIDDEGLLQDLIVRPLEQVHYDVDGERDADASYAIVAGARRYHAAMDAGYEEVPCKVFEADDLDAAWTSLSENIDRKDLSEHEIAQQLKFIYELVRPLSEPAECPDCGASVDGEASLHGHYGQTDCEPADIRLGDETAADGGDALTVPGRDRFHTDRKAKRYLAQRFLGRDDQNAITRIAGHLRTAELPEPLPALFKSPEERTVAETTTLENYNIDTQLTLGSGEGLSGTSREVIALHDTVETELADDAVDPAAAILETVGSFTQADVSEQELRRTLREFRSEITADLDASQSADEQRRCFNERLQACAEGLREMYEEVQPKRPFKKVDVLGPETQRHSRWHARAKAQRDVTGHGDLVRELYQERLETLADEHGWD